MSNVEEELSRWLASCEPDGGLRDGWYVRLDAWDDPVTGKTEMLRGPSVSESMERIITRSTSPASFLMAGFRGTGKTTELGRLRRSLVAGGKHAVVSFSAADYHHMNDAISREELGLVIAAGIAEASSDTAWKKSLWQSIASFLTTLLPSELSVKLGPVELKGILRSSSEPDFRKRLHDAFSQRPDEFRAFVHQIAERAVAHFSPARLVVLVDGLDKYYADVTSLGSVYRKMADRFAQDFDLLHLPGCNVVYVVPPYLAFLHQNVADRYGGRPFLMASVKVHDRPPARLPFEPGRRALGDLLSRRVDLDRLFGTEREACVSELAEASGGHVRDLLLLIRQVIAQAPATLPVSLSHVRDQVQSLSNARSVTFREEVALLRRIVADGQLRDVSDQEIGALARSFDQQLLLCYHNGQPWYDVHPLVRPVLDGA